MYAPEWLKPREKRHTLGFYVETREEALVEAYNLRNWYGDYYPEDKRKAWSTMVNLCRDPDLDKKELYIEPAFAKE